MNQRGVIHLLPLVLIIAVIAAGIYLVYSGIIKLPSVPIFQKGTTKVDLKSEYKNPFDKKTQYVNPFNTYKNPFVVNR